MGEKLGQNFLESEEIISKIITAAELKSDDVVLEVGPGKGVLTQELLKRAGKIVAIELDSELSKLLLNKFSNKKNIEISNEDILKFDTRRMVPGYKLIANIPYYITAPIIKKFLESKNAPSEMILMVQKEVAERIVAKPGKMSKLAVSVQYYARAEILFHVEKENFNPVPKVDSAAIKIMDIKKYNPADTKKFFQIVRAGFCAKRKTLVNNLSNSLHLDKKKVEEKLKAVPLSGTARAQELSVDKWKELAKIF